MKGSENIVQLKNTYAMTDHLCTPLGLAKDRPIHARLSMEAVWGMG